MSSTLLKYPETLDDWYPLSIKETRQLNKTSEIALDHDSGGSYSMVAALWNPKPIDFGFNNLLSPARLKYSTYPKISGIHAELQVCLDNPTNTDGASIFIAGRITSSRSKMSSTLPCHICAQFLVERQVRWVYAYYNKQPVKVRPEDMLLNKE